MFFRSLARSRIMQIVVVGALALLLAAYFLSSVSNSRAEKPHSSGATPWSYSKPEQQGFDSAVLVEMLERIKADDVDIHSIILMRNDAVFFEFYNYPYGPDTLQHTMSVGKSVVSALTGIALNEGKLSGLDDALLSSFPELQDEITTPAKREITLSHALTMTTGLEAGDDNQAVLSDVMRSSSWVEQTWRQSVSHPPGETYTYASLVTHLIAQTVQRGVNQDLMDYAREKLFDPIGAGNILIERDPEGLWFGAGGLWMTSQDMLRFGRLYLQNGKWEKEQVVPKAWVKASTRNQIGELSANASGIEGAKYGYQWWVFDDSYAAVGVGGQMILVVPYLEFVAVITRAEPDFDLVDDYIFPALKTVLWDAKANPDAVAEMNAQLAWFSERPALDDAKQQIINDPVFVGWFDILGNEPPSGSRRYEAFRLQYDEDGVPLRLSIKTAASDWDLELGTQDRPAFTSNTQQAKRPDGDGVYAAASWWETEETLIIDFHELGYPVKERWVLFLEDGQPALRISTRGAASSRQVFILRAYQTESVCERPRTDCAFIHDIQQ